MKFQKIFLSMSMVALLSGCNSSYFKEGHGSYFLNDQSTKPLAYEGSTAATNPDLTTTAAQRMPAWQTWRDLQGYTGQRARMLGIVPQEDQPRVSDVKRAYPVDNQPVAETVPLMDEPSQLVATDDYGQLVQKVYFNHGSSHLGSLDKKHINEVANGIKNTAGPVSVTVVGHASTRVDGVNDPVQRKMINFEMAQKRANAVTQALQKSGVSPDMVRSVSKGDEEPNADIGNKSQESADRRVELFVDSPAKEQK